LRSFCVRPSFRPVSMERILELPTWSLGILVGLCVVAGIMRQQYRFLEAAGGFFPVAVVLAAAACLAENSSIAWYGFYSYSSDWGIFLGHVPLHVVLIWPLFILGELRYLREGLNIRVDFPGVANNGEALALRAVFCFVDTVLLANLVEIYCVSAGLWSWRQENCLGVPWMGAIGWAFFATPAVVVLSLVEGLGSDVSFSVWCLLGLPVVCLVVLHLGLALTWNAGGRELSSWVVSPWQEAAGILALQWLYQRFTKSLKQKPCLRLVEELPRVLACGIVASLWLLKGRISLGVCAVSAASLVRMLAFEL